MNEAIGFLRQVQKSLGDGPFGREVIAEALSHASSSGVLSTKVGSLTHFDLLQREGNVYRVSELGKRILYPQPGELEGEAIAEAAQAPALYKDIVAEYAGKSLPSLLKNILIQKFKVSSSSANDVAE